MVGATRRVVRYRRLGEPPLPFATTKLQRNAADGLFTRPSKKADLLERTGPMFSPYFFCQGAGVVSGQSFSIGSLLSKDHPIQELS